MKKAQGLTLNTMVMTVLLIIVLVIGIALFYNFINGTVEPGITDPVKCDAGLGETKCVPSGECKKSIGERDCPDNKICCITG